jgi:chitin disaccharide deacetylase
VGGECLVIVNADDWGADAEATDAIISCFEAGRVTSTTAMVHMGDSDRAAAIARERSLPVGLHLNLTVPYEAPDVPEPERVRQARIVRAFRPINLRRWRVQPRRWRSYPRFKADVERCAADQLARFRELYGNDPTHVDGHHQVHLAPTVLTSRAIPDGYRIRNTYRRGVRQREIAQRYVSPERFVWLGELRPFGEASLDERIAGASSVEIEVHPKLGELDYLLSDDWGRELQGRRLGSFADLARH